jgi:hypothetical protein
MGNSHGAVSIQHRKLSVGTCDTAHTNRIIFGADIAQEELLLVGFLAPRHPHRVSGPDVCPRNVRKSRILRVRRNQVVGTTTLVGAVNLHESRGWRWRHIA